MFYDKEFTVVARTIVSTALALAVAIYAAPAVATDLPDTDDTLLEDDTDSPDTDDTLVEDDTEFSAADANADEQPGTSDLPCGDTKQTEAEADACKAAQLPKGIWGRPVERGGFHFQVSFGLGGGPDSLGLFHAMEIGGTFSNGWTLGVLHTFIQNKGILGQHGGPDLYGGWLLQLKVPLGFPDLVGKVALGPGGTHDQSDGIKVHGGFGASYGVDVHFPFFFASGMTFGVSALHVVAQSSHFFGVAFGLGYTWF